MAETILQHWIVTQFILPFLLIYFIVFGALIKSKVFSADKQLNALIALVVGLIFVGAIFPKIAVGNLILFLTVAMVTLFVAMLLWGFVAGEDGLKFEKIPGPIKGAILGVILVSVALALIWALGIDTTFIDYLFRSTWSKEFWTNAAFVAVVIIALGMMVKGGKSA